MAAARRSLLLLVLLWAVNVTETVKNQEGNDVAVEPPPIRPNKIPPTTSQPPPLIRVSGNSAEKVVRMESNGLALMISAQGPKPRLTFWTTPNEMQVFELHRIFQVRRRLEWGNHRTDYALLGEDRGFESVGPLANVEMDGTADGYSWSVSNASEARAANGSSTANTTIATATLTGVPSLVCFGDSCPVRPALAYRCHMVSSPLGTEAQVDLTLSGFQDAWWERAAEGLAIAYNVATGDSAGGSANLTASAVRIQADARRPNRPRIDEGWALQTGGGVERVAMDFGNGNGVDMEVPTRGSTLEDNRWVTMTLVTEASGDTYVLHTYERKASGGLTHSFNLFSAAASGTLDPDAFTTSTFDGAVPHDLSLDLAAGASLRWGGWWHAAGILLGVGLCFVQTA